MRFVVNRTQSFFNYKFTYEPEWFFLPLFGVIKSVAHQTVGLGVLILIIIKIIFNFFGRASQDPGFPLVWGTLIIKIQARGRATCPEEGLNSLGPHDATSPVEKKFIVYLKVAI